MTCKSARGGQAAVRASLVPISGDWISRPLWPFALTFLSRILDGTSAFYTVAPSVVSEISDKYLYFFHLPHLPYTSTMQIAYAYNGGGGDGDRDRFRA